MLLRSLMRGRSPAGHGGRLSVLIFHRVHRTPDPLLPGEVDAERFERICAWLRAWFNVLPLAEAVRRMSQDELPERACAITFDDGYADNHDVAMPILQRHGLPATIFVATGFLDGGRMWNDTVIEAIRRARVDEVDLSPMLRGGPRQVRLATLQDRRDAIDTVIGHAKYLPPTERQQFVDRFASALGVDPPGDLMMSSPKVRGLLKGGLQVGAHTVNHPILKGLPRSQVVAELEGSRQVLERLTDSRVSVFAYPNGKAGVDFDDATVQVVKDLGFDAAVTTHPGAGRAGVDRFRIPRYTPWQASRWRFGWGLYGNLGRPPVAEAA